MSKHNNTLSQSRLLELLQYNPKTGIFTWREDRGGAKAGKAAGNLNSSGYLRIGIEGKSYAANRLVWLYVHGHWPKGQVDHRDGDPANNRLKNLRDCTRAENAQNQKLRKNSTSGYPGVYWHKGAQRWRARIMKDRKQFHLGQHATAELAHAAYLTAKRVLHTFQPTPRST